MKDLGLTGKWNKVKYDFLSKGVAFASTFFRVPVNILEKEINLPGCHMGSN